MAQSGSARVLIVFLGLVIIASGMLMSPTVTSETEVTVNSDYGSSTVQGTTEVPNNDRNMILLVGFCLALFGVVGPTGLLGDRNPLISEEGGNSLLYYMSVGISTIVSGVIGFFVGAYALAIISPYSGNTMGVYAYLLLIPLGVGLFLGYVGSKWVISDLSKATENGEY